MSYDSRPETQKHIIQVRILLRDVIWELQRRGQDHDASKLIEPERSMFDEFTPKLKKLEYGSEEYNECRKAMGEALKHHYEHNDHHPEHFEFGIEDMDLLQLIEMLADWKAATLRVADGDLARSIALNADRFGYTPEVERILFLTAQRLGWL